MSQVPPTQTAQQAQQQIISAAGAARSQYDLAFQVSPIMLQGGIAANQQGGMIPIIQLYGQLGALSGGTVTNPNQFFARYIPLPGSTLISQSVGMYPFANQQVAANATIQQPLTLSLLMIAPVNQPGGYFTKLATFTALQNKLNQHNISGGTYSVATPAFVYNGLLMTAMTDVTEGDSLQKQIEYQIDFIQPLITISAAAAAQNTLMQKITNGGQLPNPPTVSGLTAAQTPLTTTGLPAALAQFGGQFGAAPVNPSGVDITE